MFLIFRPFVLPGFLTLSKQAWAVRDVALGGRYWLKTNAWASWYTTWKENSTSTAHHNKEDIHIQQCICIHSCLGLSCAVFLFFEVQVDISLTLDTSWCSLCSPCHCFSSGLQGIPFENFTCSHFCEKRRPSGYIWHSYVSPTISPERIHVITWHQRCPHNYRRNDDLTSFVHKSSEVDTPSTR